jgi:hypothetical protein
MSDITLSMGVDASGLESGVSKAKSTLKSLEAQVNQRGIFERLNNDVKNIGGTFASLRDQLAGGNIVGALATVSKAGSNMAGGMGMLAPILGSAGLAMAGVAVAAGGMWSAMSKAKEMRDVADQSGLLVSELAPLEKVFGRVGLESEQIPVVMTKLRESLSTLNDPASKASQAFAKIGLTAESFKGKSYYEGLKIIGSALANAKDKTDALNASTEAFGAKKGTKVGQALAGADFGKMEAQTPESVKIIEEQGEVFQRFQIAIGRLKPSMDSFFLGMASKVVPELEAGAAGVSSSANTLVEAGKSFGTVLAGTINALKTVASSIKSLFDSAPDWIKSPAGAGANATQAQGAAFMGPALINAQAGVNSQEAKPLINLPSIEEGPAKKGAGIDTGEGKNLKIERTEPITTSLAKMGGGASGMNADALSVQREQLSVMQQMLNALNKSKDTQGKASMIDIYGNSDIAVSA